MGRKKTKPSKVITANKHINIPSLISNNKHLAPDMRPLVLFAPRPHRVDTMPALVVDLCKRTHLVGDILLCLSCVCPRKIWLSQQDRGASERSSFRV